MATQTRRSPSRPHQPPTGNARQQPAPEKPQEPASQPEPVQPAQEPATTPIVAEEATQAPEEAVPQVIVVPGASEYSGEMLDGRPDGFVITEWDGAVPCEPVGNGLHVRVTKDVYFRHTAKGQRRYFYKLRYTKGTLLYAASVRRVESAEG